MKRFFIDKIDTNQYAVYDRLKIGYIKPLVYTDRTVSLNYTQSVCDLLNDCDAKMNEAYEKLIIGKGSSEVIDMIKFGDNLYGVAIKELFDRNKKLEEDIDNEKNDYRELASNYIYLQEKNMKLIKENKQLKQQLFYDGDDVCDICKHRYLVPSGAYFISKCKKEHEECSKEDIRYCKDFESKVLNNE